MNDIDEFFAEQDRRMGLPDQDIDDYIQARLEATQKKHGAQGYDTPSEGTRVRSAGMQAQHLLRHSSTTVSFKSPQRDHEAGIAPDSKPNHDGQPQSTFTRHRPGSSETKCNREESDSEMDSSCEGARHVVPGVLSEFSSPGTHNAKRRKTTHDDSRSKPADFPLCTSIPKSPVPNSDTSRKAQSQDRSALLDISLEYSSVNLVNTRLLPQHSPTNDQSNVSSSTDLAHQEYRDPTTWSAQCQIAHMPGVVIQSPRSSNLDETRRSPSKVFQTPRRRQFDTLPILADDKASVIDASSPAPVSSHSRALASGSTVLDDHARDVVETSEQSHTGHILPSSSMGGIQQSAIAQSPSRPSNDTHEDNSARRYPVPRTPAGSHTKVHADVSNITSPSYTPSRRSGAMTATSDAAVHDAQTIDVNGPKPRKTVNSARRSRKSSTIVSNSKKAKEKPKLVTPLEYAQRLQPSLDLSVRNKNRANHLHGKRIFYVGGDMLYASTRTRGCMEYIVNHGGTLVPKYDPNIVTHIVTDTTTRPTLQALSLKSLLEIPDHIPTVKWSWVVSGYGKTRRGKTTTDIKGKGKATENDGREDDLMDFEFLHAAFPERINAGRNWQHSRHDKEGGVGGRDQAGSANDLSADISQISAFSQETKSGEVKERGGSLTVLPPPPLDFRTTAGHNTAVAADNAPAEAQAKPFVNEDPLAEYYAQARAEREAQWNRDASDSDGDGEEFEEHPGPVPRRGFACDMKGLQPGACVNQYIVDKLEELRELHKAKPSEDDRWRAYSYGKCISALRNYHKPIRSFSEARSIRGVGEKTALKIMEIINTGDLRRIKYETTDEVESTRAFQGIYGVGRQTAFSWFASGLRTLDDVRARKGGLKLSTVQEIGLKYYEDINSRMPREEARKIFEVIKPIALAIDDKLFIQIMGSYRRGKADCGDIDILITRPTADGNTHQGILLTLLGRLHAAGILTEDLAIPEDFSDLELVYRGLCKLPEPGVKHRRIDFLCVPWESRGAALLYYTGDDIFNRSMRLKANKHGYSLNQRGLYAGVVRDSRDRQKKTCEGSIVASETEEEIFRILGVPWQEPHERVRS